jgi:zinc transport system substrate-binding protein
MSLRQPLAAVLVGAAWLAFQPAAAADLHVVASIKPIHSLVAAVMQGVGEPTLVVKGASSPHTYNMRPSDAAALSKADVVFWGGHQLEQFLEKPLQSLGGKATEIALMDDPSIMLLAPREGGTFEADDDEDHDHAGHGDAADPHFWLDPENGRAALKIIAATLSSKDPAHAAIYAANADKADGELQALEAHLAGELAPFRTKPFIVFHDAYHYFEKRFDIRAAGSITVSPETQPGAQRVAEIEDKIRSLGAACIFSEPQFEPKLIDAIAAGSKSFKGVLDPLGADIPDGPGLYPALLIGLADNLKTCLARET